MNRLNPIVKSLFLIGIIGTLVISTGLLTKSQAAPSFSISNDFLPYQEFTDPVINTVTGTDTTFFDNPQVQLKKLRASLSYPIVFSEGRTVLVNHFSYQLIEFRYRQLKAPLERAHSASYTLMLQHQLSQKWSIWALGTPSLASDLKAELSRDDFSIQAATVFIRHFSERLSLGLGAAYSTQFGSAVPLPVLALDWNNGKNLMAKAILPVSFEFWYRPGRRLDLGLLMSGDGNNFRGDPAIYEVANPELRYTMLTVGPATRISLFDRVRLNVEAGLVGLHRFEFYDSDNKAASYDLKPDQYVRIGFQYGE
jgi:hypothetical protein